MKTKFGRLKVGDTFTDYKGRRACKIEHIQIGGMSCNYYVFDFKNVDDLVLSYATNDDPVTLEEKDRIREIPTE